MRFGCFALLGAICLVVFGVQGVREAYSFRKPVEMTCGAFVKAPPQEGWYHISGCEMELDEAAYSVTTSHDKEETDSNGNLRITEVYLPVHVSRPLEQTSEKEEPITLVLKTEDPSLIATLQRMDRLEHSQPEVAKKWLVDNLQSVFLHKDISGMLENSLDSNDSTRKKIAEMHGSMAPNYVILQEGKTPSMSRSLLMTVGGIILGIFSLLYWASVFTGRTKKRW